MVLPLKDRSIVKDVSRSRFFRIGLAASLGTAVVGILVWLIYDRQVRPFPHDSATPAHDLREPKGFLDVTGAALSANGITNIVGWATHDAGIHEATLIVNEERRLPLATGIPRPDVAAQFPLERGASRAGFEGNYDLGPAVYGSHRVEVELKLANGKVARLGPWMLSRPPASRSATGSQEVFHVSIATSNLAKGGAEGIKERFGPLESQSIRIGLTVPILYMRTTLGEDKDWAFDPSFDLSRNCPGKDRRLAEDNLTEVIEFARRERFAVLFTLNGGVWADSACDDPHWDLNDALEREDRHCQWSNGNEVPRDTYLGDLPGSIEAPEIARVMSYNVFNTKPRTYKRRNLKAAARIIAEFARRDPDLFIGVNLDSDTYLNPFFEGRMWFDYNPDTLKQFRDWLRGSGPYAADWHSAEIPNLHALRRKPSLRLDEAGALMGRPLREWDEVEPPRKFSAVVDPYWKQPWTAVWEEFRRHLVDLHYDELSQWVHEAGVPRERIFSSQGFHPPRPPIDPFSVELNSPAKNYDTGGMSVAGAVPKDGLLGAVLYGDSARNRIPTETGETLFAIFRRKSPKGWAVVESHPANLHEPRRVPGLKDSFNALREPFRGGASFVSLMSWNGGSGKYRNEKAYVSFIVIRDTPLEDAIKALMTTHAGVPRGSLVWTFGSLAHNDDEGWEVRHGRGNPEFGRFRLQVGHDGDAILIGPDLGRYAGEYRGLDLGLRASETGTLTISLIDAAQVQHELAVLPLSGETRTDTKLSQFALTAQPGARLQLRFQSSSGALLTIERIALWASPR